MNNSKVDEKKAIEPNCCLIDKVLSIGFMIAVCVT